MFDAMAVIGARFLLQSIFKSVQDHFNLTIAIGMNAGLQAGFVHGENDLVQGLLGPRGWNAEILRAIGIRFREPAGLGRERIPMKKFNSSVTDTIITQPAIAPA